MSRSFTNLINWVFIESRGPACCPCDFVLMRRGSCCSLKVVSRFAELIFPIPVNSIKSFASSPEQCFKKRQIAQLPSA